MLFPTVPLKQIPKYDVELINVKLSHGGSELENLLAKLGDVP